MTTTFETLPLSHPDRSQPGSPPTRHPTPPVRRHGWAFALVAALAVASAWALTPGAPTAPPPPPLAQSVPTAFGAWQALEATGVQVALAVNTDGTRTTDQPYDDVLMRTYRHADGTEVMLAVAYAGRMQQDVKIHRPEVCYEAQGHSVVRWEPHAVADGQVPRGTIPGVRMLTHDGRVQQVVMYWIRIGPTYTYSAWTSRWTILTEGLRGRVLDGVLVRASMVTSPSQFDSASRSLETFLADLSAASSPTSARSLFGSTSNL